MRYHSAFSKCLLLRQLFCNERNLIVAHADQNEFRMISRFRNAPGLRAFNKFRGSLCPVLMPAAQINFAHACSTRGKSHSSPHFSGTNHGKRMNFNHEYRILKTKKLADYDIIY